MNPILSSLSPSEREALSTCGILNDGQLAGVDVDTLLRDLQMAKEAFPEANFGISEDKLRDICAHAAGTALPQVKEEPSSPETTVQQRKDGDDGIFDDDSIEEEEAPPRALPELSVRRHQHRSARRTASSLAEAPGVSSSVHCSRPITTYLAACSMVFFYTGVLFLFLLPFLVFTGYMDSEYLIPCACVSVALLIPYLFVGIWCHCSVCKMNFFRLVPYNLNKHAHLIPFLGLTTLLTALHIIFRLWYRCPACGTAIRLYRSRHSHRR